VTDHGTGDSVRTIAESTRVEIEKVKGSRFICDLAPAADERAAFAVIDHVRSLEPTATHHCWAYRLESGSMRSSDDGEPGGTAGAPILRRLEAAGLSDTVAVVTRYYGGTNLGTGGLIRAYGAAVAAAIDAAELITRHRRIGFRVTHPYQLSSAVEAVLSACQATVESSEYAEHVTLAVRVPVGVEAQFLASMQEETAGIVVPESID
jgi:uncharacterized YigZ family protein